MTKAKAAPECDACTGWKEAQKAGVEALGIEAAVTHALVLGTARGIALSMGKTEVKLCAGHGQVLLAVLRRHGILKDESGLPEGVTVQ